MERCRNALKKEELRVKLRKYRELSEAFRAV